MTLDIGKLKQIAQAPAQENWMYGTAKQEPMTKEERAEWLAEPLHGRRRTAVGGLVPGPAEIMIPAVTGDGPSAEQNAAFISTFNPPTVLALLARIEELEAEKHKAGEEWAKEYATARELEAAVQRVREFADRIEPIVDTVAAEIRQALEGGEE